MGNEAGTAALRAIDKLLAERPEKVGPDFSEATRQIVGYRNALIDQSRKNQSAPDQQRLMQVNSVLSVVIGGHFPLGGVPWKQIESARDVLARLVAVEA